jgi:outer membrane protein assembly factor BamA
MNTCVKFIISLTFLILLLFFNLKKVAAQVDISLSYQNSFEKKLPTIQLPKQIKSLSELNILTTNLLQNLHNEGYWNAKLIPFTAIDSLSKDKSTSKKKIELVIDLGKQAFWKELRTKSLPTLIQKNVISDFERKDFLKKLLKNDTTVPVNSQDIKKLQEAILKYAENNGYPMARTSLDSAEIIDTKERIYFSANLTYQSGSLIQFDSLIIDGNAKIKKDFLMNYLHIQKGKFYQENTVKNAVRLLKTMPYLKLNGRPNVEFRYDRAYLRLPLKKVKSSQFDGVIGFLPKSQAGAASGNSQNSSGSNLLLTGQVKLHLINPFGAGKTIAFEWQRIRPESQTLYANYQHPNFLKTNLELGGNFNFIKEDSTFSIVERRANIAYPSARFGKIGFFTSLLTTSRTGIIRNTDTANVPTADSRFWHYGISHSYNTLDDIYFPRKGFQISTEISTGNKTFTDSLSRSRISDTQQNNDFKSPQLKFNTDVNLFFKVNKLSSIRLRTQIQFIESKNLFLNELLRVGGLQNLRGFDPNSFFVSRYGLLGAEWRFYFEERSYLMAFAEQAAVRAFTRRNEVYLDLPTSAGAGISFSTKTGVFYFVYAMGNSKTQAVSVINSKIHFGLISQF